jgi:hypothetical protein
MDRTTSNRGLARQLGVSETAVRRAEKAGVAATALREDDMPFEIQTPQPEPDAEPARPDAAAPEPKRSKTKLH